MHVSLNKAMAGGEGMRVPDVYDPGCGAYFVCSLYRRLGLHWCGSETWGHVWRCAKSEVSTPMRMTFTSGEDKKKCSVTDVTDLDPIRAS